MARMYKSERTYQKREEAKVRKQIQKLGLLLTFISGIFCAFSYQVIQRIFSGQFEFKEWGLFFLIYISVIILGYLIGKSLWIRVKQWKKGRAGEEKVEEVLADLADKYLVFSGLTLPNGRGDIDFIVVGDSGVWLLEVKSHRGIFSVRDGKLTSNRFLKKDFIKQIESQVRALRSFLERKNLNVKITGVLVLSDERAQLVGGLGVVGGTFVVPLAAVPDLINHKSSVEFNGVEKVGAILKGLVS